MSQLLIAVAESAHHIYIANPPDPGTGLEPPGQTGAQLTKILGWVAWIVLALCVGGVLVVGGKMALSHQRGQGGEHATGLAYVLAACVLVGSASALVAALA